MTSDEYENEYRERIKRIMAKYEKKPYVKEPPKPVKWTAKELRQFKEWGCNPQIVQNDNQQTLF